MDRSPKKIAILSLMLFLSVGILALGLIYWRSRPAHMPETDLFSAGQLAANRGSCDQALIYYRALLQKDPKHSTAIEFMAECQIKLKDLKGAIASYENLVSLDSSDRYKSRLASLYDSAGLTEKAKQVRPSPQASASK